MTRGWPAWAASWNVPPPVAGREKSGTLSPTASVMCASCAVKHPRTSGCVFPICQKLGTLHHQRSDAARHCAADDLMMGQGVAIELICDVLHRNDTVSLFLPPCQQFFESGQALHAFAFGAQREDVWMFGLERGF